MKKTASVFLVLLMCLSLVNIVSATPDSQELANVINNIESHKLNIPSTIKDYDGFIVEFIEPPVLEVANGPGIMTYGDYEDELEDLISEKKGGS